MITFDKDCIGFNRKKTLDLIFSDENNIIYYSNQNNCLNGYIVTKILNHQAEIGPLVVRSNSESIVLNLLKKALFNLSGYNTLIYVPKNNQEINTLLINSGLNKETSLIRMFLGSPITIDCLYLPESLERG